ncbi:hypothetical protein ESA94_00025 [Lacibacter luteus]|uniref:SV2A/B/C luminal domain-containing protein n=1 Tax=Lacibacter luteus TaxID=2508719 RepID=A0A4V1M7T2_9BACT|nr:pentapeptide repeat-containing protein [Lacibacter luteus]RXK61442.1 hypothetical protein ESA94_00025 [Lacibacter luteus]
MEEQTGTVYNYLDFSETEYGSADYRNDIKNKKFQFISFNKSSFQNCNLTNVIFKDCHFTRCDFTEIRQWNCVYENCKFFDTKFYNSAMGVQVKYSNCQFVKSKLTGKYFTFGQNTEFNKCTFEKCDIKSTWILSIIFKECAFSSRLTNVRFSGEKEAKVSSTSGHSEFPATFINCDFSNSIFEDLEIMDGAILTDSLLPNQHSKRFNNDRIYFPKE